MLLLFLKHGCLRNGYAKRAPFTRERDIICPPYIVQIRGAFIWLSGAFCCSRHTPLSIRARMNTCCRQSPFAHTRRLFERAVHGAIIAVAAARFMPACLYVYGEEKTMFNDDITRDMPRCHTHILLAPFTDMTCCPSKTRSLFACLFQHAMF